MRAAIALAAALLLGACATEEPAARRPDMLEKLLEEPAPASRAERVADAIATRIEATYPLVEVWDVSLTDDQRRVAYAVRLNLDARAEHPDPADWQAHVSQAARDQREAAVTMLKSTVELLPRVGYVSVWQDEFLQPFWARRQIREMADARSYRRFERYQDLVMSAAVLPGRPA